jgi:ABC-type uncharacterized transport system ATPase subunit
VPVSVGKNDIDKSIKALSGGEKGRMLFGKLMLQNPNVLVMMFIIFVISNSLHNCQNNS